MRILLCCYEYPPIGGGGGVSAQQYAEAWANEGHDVSVLTSGGLGLPKRDTVSGVEIIRVHSLKRADRATATFSSMLAYNLFAFLYIAKNRRSLFEVEVINTHFSLPSGPVGWLASKFLGVPNVLTIIGGDIYDPSKRLSPHDHALLRLINRWIIRSADQVIAISSDTKKRAKAYYDIARHIHVINYGFSPPALKEPALTFQFAADRFYLIAVGRLVKRKGFDDLIRAMVKLPEDVELLLVGDGPMEDDLVALGRQSGAEDRIHFLGYQTREEICWLMRSSQCFVLSSLHEGLGIVVQEAMDAGLPVVATDNGGQVDLIKPNRNGILVPVGSPDALADAIQRIYADSTLARKMGQQNAADIKNLYMDQNSQNYIRIFNDAIEAKTVHAAAA